MKKNIEAFARYHHAKESLAEYAQIGTAAIHLLRRNITVSNGASLLGEFVDSCGSDHWSVGKKFPDPVPKTAQIGEMFCRHVLVQQVAAFDLFTRSVVSDFSRFSSWARTNCEELAHSHSLVVLSSQDRWVSASCCHEQENKLGLLSSRLTDVQKLIKWKPSKCLEEILPLFDLARICRNRVVHSDGLVGAELEEVSASAEVKSALKEFRKHYMKADAPLLPHWARGASMSISPENAIFFGAVLYEIAKEINSYVCEKITDAEFVEMAFYYSCVVETHSFRTIKHRAAEARIKHFLASRYLYKEASKIKNVSIPLKRTVATQSRKRQTVETTLWKVALERHEQLHKQESAVEQSKIAVTQDSAEASEVKKINKSGRKKVDRIVR